MSNQERCKLGGNVANYDHSAEFQPLLPRRSVTLSGTAP